MIARETTNVLTMKKCFTCKTLKTADSFHRFSKSKTGCQSSCKDCVRITGRTYQNSERVKSSRLMKLYNIGLEEWKSMFESQGKQCKICATKTQKAGNGTGWQTDHDHTTGKVRGILCHNCNALLGHAKDSPEILKAAIGYLKHEV